MPTSNHATSVHYCVAKIPKVVDCVLVTCVLCALTGWVRGLYGGVGPTVLKGAVNNCIRFGTFNEMKHMYLQAQGRTGGTCVLTPSVSCIVLSGEVVAAHHSSHFLGCWCADDAEGGVALHPLESLGLGAISGGLSAIATHPIE